MDAKCAFEKEKKKKKAAVRRRVRELCIAGDLAPLFAKRPSSSSASTSLRSPASYSSLALAAFAWIGKKTPLWRAQLLLLQRIERELAGCRRGGVGENMKKTKNKGEEERAGERIIMNGNAEAMIDGKSKQKFGKKSGRDGEKGRGKEIMTLLEMQERLTDLGILSPLRPGIQNESR